MQRVLHTSSLMVLGLLSLLAAGCDTPTNEELDLLEAEAMQDEESFGSPDEIALETNPYSGNNYFVPVGTHDLANCDLLEGWVKDGDTTSPTWVTIYKGAPFPYGVYVATAYANVYRGDLPFTDKNHGFSLATPAAFKTGNWETVYIHGINVDAGGAWAPPGAQNPLLNLTGKSICCGSGCDGGDGDDDGGSFTTIDPPQP
ncbi:hypothetical protein ACNOYE_18425 [Nannocystaceae bacterium ST9]